MTARQISDELSLPYTRISNRLKKMRKTNEVTCTVATDYSCKGVKPMKYLLASKTN
jgi:DNA-binding transcriptional regulator LsrR (DeoR family)